MTDPNALGVEIARLGDLETQAIGLETAARAVQDARDAFFAEGNPGAGFANSAEIGDEAARLEGLGSAFANLETSLNDAQIAYDAAVDAQIAAEQDAIFLNFDGHPEPELLQRPDTVFLRFEYQILTGTDPYYTNTYGGVFNISNPISLTDFRAIAEVLLFAPAGAKDLYVELSSVSETLKVVTYNHGTNGSGNGNSVISPDTIDDVLESIGSFTFKHRYRAMTLGLLSNSTSLVFHHLVKGSSHLLLLMLRMKPCKQLMLFL